MSLWGSPVEMERHRRIRLSVAAYAYEFEHDSIMTDAEFDALALLVKPKMRTGNARIDAFFRNHFEPSTGLWVRKHPELERIKGIYDRHWKNRPK